MSERDTGNQSPITHLSDGELAKRVTEGQDGPPVESELVSRYARRVRLYGRRHLRSEDAAQDLVQRVLMITLEKLRSGQVREPERIGAFVLDTARTTALDMKRKHARESALDTRDESSTMTPPNRSNPLAMARLRTCFEELSDRERSILVGSYFGEISTDRIAASLGTTPDEVRQMRHRAVERLRTCLRDKNTEAD